VGPYDATVPKLTSDRVMPFYEYECSACKFYVEALQKISDPPIKKCPSCKKQSMKRLLSAPVFRLKGGGWYETDFKSDKENKRNLVGEDKEPSSDTKSEAKADSKETAKSSDTKPEAAAIKPAEKRNSAPKKAVSKTKSKTPAKKK
jgi:putative FmdB family regulatory protein